MPETQKQWIKRFEEDGWIVDRGGKHQTKMCKPGCRPITLPENHRRAYSRGLEAQLRKELQENQQLADAGTTTTGP